MAESLLHSITGELLSDRPYALIGSLDKKAVCTDTETVLSDYSLT